MYAEIVDNKIIEIYNSLPLNYKNISNFFALEPSFLSDLSWNGYANTHFYEYITQGIPDSIPSNVKLVGPEYIIDHENKKVIGAYTTELIENPPPSPLSNQQVSARQIRLWLVQNGIELNTIDDVISAIPDPSLRSYTKIEWEYAPYIERNHPMLIPLASALGLSEEQVDQAFIEASIL